ncbi:MAG: metallophosphoesterase family protein [Deltaproteobacteria bacterium]|nr:metallophosphoesterase family protein [Deltaproteobacteria bacterium]
MKIIYLLSLIFFTFLPLLNADPKYIRLSYTKDASSTITIVWHTDIETDTMVKYGKKSGVYTNSATGNSFKANGLLNYIHEVTLTGLEPDTTYYYIVGSNSDGFSSERSFKTGPKEDINCAEFSFGYHGDNRPDPTFGGGENWPKILEQCAAHGPSFTISGGDLVIDGDKIDQWIKFLGWTEKVASSIPFMPTIGNHDDGPGQGDSANYNQIFALPRSAGIYGSNTEDYYYFTYGNAIFVSLSTQTFKEGSIPFEKQAKWLDEVLTNNPKKWKFVYYHHPSYTKNVVFDISHQPNEVNQNAALIPVFDKHHVDIVFTSHNHWYERFEPSACSKLGNAGSDQPCPVGEKNFDKGTVYVVSGGAGAFTIPGLLCGTMKGRVKCSGDHHYIIVKIKDEVLTYEAYSAYPQQNKMMDTFTISKTIGNCSASIDAGYQDVLGDGLLLDIILSDEDSGISSGDIRDIGTNTGDESVQDIFEHDTFDISENIVDKEMHDFVDLYDSTEQPDRVDDNVNDIKTTLDIAARADVPLSDSSESVGCGCLFIE